MKHYMTCVFKEQAGSEGVIHQGSIAGVIYVDGTGGGGVHVAEQALDLPQGNSSSSIRHLSDRSRAGRERCHFVFGRKASEQERTTG